MTNSAPARTEPTRSQATRFVPVLEEAWLLQFHSPTAALNLCRDWIALPEPRTISDEAFHYIILAACAVRTESVENMRILVEQAEALVSQLPLDRRSARLRAIHRSVTGNLKWRLRELETAIKLFDTALAQSGALEPADVHVVRHWRAITLVGLGHPELAFRDSLSAREFFRDRDPAACALLSFNVGAMLVHAGDWSAAETSMREAAAAAHLVGVAGFPIMCRSNLAYCLINTGRTEEAREQILQALEIDRAEALRFKPGDVLTTVAEILIETGFLDEAEQYVKSALQDAMGRGFALGIGTANWNAGRIALLRGDSRQALRCWAIAVQHLRRHPHMSQLWKTAREIARLYDGQREFRRALRWHQRFHHAYLRWQASTRGIRLAYTQAILDLETTRAERDAAHAERARLKDAMAQLEKLNTELHNRVHQVEMLQGELREQAMRDPLTGLLNRRGLPDTLASMIVEARRTSRSASVAMLDLDNFKQVNDQYGHALGDRLLSAAGALLLEHFRRSDVAFRFGGDEFCVLLPGASRTVAEGRLGNLAERLRATLKEIVPTLPFEVTVSVGLATFPDDGTTASALLDASDTALYRAKRARAAG